jgi:uncharacterized membrane protein YfcA
VAPLTLVLLFFAAALGGALNAVAGGGSFIAFPSLLFAGIAPVAANATNTVALWPAGVASVVAYRREVTGSRAVLLVMAIASFVGGGAGALLLLHTSETAFVQLIPWLLLVATSLFTFGKKVTSRLAPTSGDASPRMLAVIAVVQTVIAVYGGYFGGGIGILMLATLSLVGMTNIHQMNALKTILSAIINGVAVVLFIVAAAVAWRPGAVMVVGGILGGYLGAALARQVDPKRVRVFVMVVAWVMTAWFFYSTYLRHRGT